MFYSFANYGGPSVAFNNINDTNDAAKFCSTSCNYPTTYDEENGYHNEDGFATSYYFFIYKYYILLIDIYNI